MLQRENPSLLQGNTTIKLETDVGLQTISKLGDGTFSPSPRCCEEPIWDA
jgi:hypothetical protein